MSRQELSEWADGEREALMEAMAAPVEATGTFVRPPPSPLPLGGGVAWDGIGHEIVRVACTATAVHLGMTMGRSPASERRGTRQIQRHGGAA